MSRTGRVAGLVLAAGASVRHSGQLKLLLPFGDDTVVGSSVRAAVAGGLSPVVVVLGHRAGAVRLAVGTEEAVFVENPRYPEGVGTSLAAGARRIAADASAEGVAILLADEPGMSSDVIRSVIARWRESPAPVLRAAYRDRPGHPVVADRSVLHLLERAEGDRGLTAVLAAEKVPIEEVSVDLEAPADIDTPRDYERALLGRAR